MVRSKVSTKKPYTCSGPILERYARINRLTIKDAMAALLRKSVWPARFLRNYGLLSAEAQIKLLYLPIFIAGLGGLGGEMAAMLARLGAGKLYLCDYDSFEESNLNRQRFCTEKNIGFKKALAAAKELNKLASYGEFEPLIIRISQDNVDALLEPCAIVIDCLDTVSGKKMLEDACIRKGKPFLHGSVLHKEGFCFFSNPASGVMTKLYGKETDVTGAGEVLCPVVVATAALMCSLFVKWLSGKETSSRLLHGDYSVPELSSFHLP